MGHYENEPAIRRLGQELRQRCLVEGRALLSDVRIWTAENFTELKKAYTDSPEAGAGSFDDKIVVQLADVSSEARQLFAELYIIEIVVLGNVLPSTKIAKIDDVLARCGPPLSLAEPGSSERLRSVGDVIRGGGVLNGGQGYSTQRGSTCRSSSSSDAPGRRSTQGNAQTS